jgi:hypothetical protein
LQVVDDAEHRLPGGKSREDAERRHPDREAVDDAVPLLESECTPKRLSLWPWELVELALCRPEELCKRHEGKIDARLPAGRAEHGQASEPALRGIVEERRLAQSGFTRDEQCGPLPPCGSLSERLERRALPLAADQHGQILIDRDAENLGVSPEHRPGSGDALRRIPACALQGDG